MDGLRYIRRVETRVDEGVGPGGRNRREVDGVDRLVWTMILKF